jgi:hypothetical protein
LALEVVAAHSEPTCNPDEWAEHDHTPVIRALQSGESNPRDEDVWLSVGVHTAGDDVLGRALLGHSRTKTRAVSAPRPTQTRDAA